MNKDKQQKSFAPVVILICVLTLFISSCCAFLIASGIKPELRDNIKENVNNFLYNEATEPSQAVENTSARLMCAGNNIIYRSIYSNAAALGASVGADYDFSPIYENIKSIISKSDLAVINQSTVLSSSISASSYPDFCSPVQVGDALYDLGFRVFNHANRNVFDKGEQGAQDTLNYWETKSGALEVGLDKNSDEAKKVDYKEVNSIKIAFLGFTESIQGTVSSDSTLKITNLGDRDHTVSETYNTMNTKIAKAKETADVVVVYMCFNDTDEITPSQQQTIDNLVSYGADVIIGCGINHIMGAERIVREDATSCVVFYSLGNFISAQDSKENMLSAIADITFEKNGQTGQTIVKSAKAVPIVTFYKRGYTDFSVLSAKNITDEDLAGHALNSYYGGLTADYVKQAFEETFDTIPDAEFSSATAD